MNHAARFQHAQEHGQKVEAVQTHSDFQAEKRLLSKKFHLACLRLQTLGTSTVPRATQHCARHSSHRSVRIRHVIQPMKWVGHTRSLLGTFTWQRLIPASIYW